MQTKHPNTETPETYTYCGITAPLALWNAVGFEVINWADETVEFPNPYSNPSKPRATDGELIEALACSDIALALSCRVTTGKKALVWLIGERRRQQDRKGPDQCHVRTVAGSRQRVDSTNDEIISASYSRRKRGTPFPHSGAK